MYADVIDTLIVVAMSIPALGVFILEGGNVSCICGPFKQHTTRVRWKVACMALS